LLKEIEVELQLNDTHLSLDDEALFSITSCHKQSNIEGSSDSHPKNGSEVPGKNGWPRSTVLAGLLVVLATAVPLSVLL